MSGAAPRWLVGVSRHGARVSRHGARVSRHGARVSRHGARSPLEAERGGAADFNRGIDSFEVVDDSPASPAAAASSSSSSSSSSSAMASRVCYFRIVGSSFLWHQVRCMVAVLFMVGRGQESSGIVRGEREGVGREKGGERGYLPARLALCCGCVRRLAA
eukprot:SAG25_NODE_122_length_14632_cov_129.472098_2_plen_160_part_00